MGGGICDTHCGNRIVGAVYSIVVCHQKFIHNPSCSISMFKGNNFFKSSVPQMGIFSTFYRLVVHSFTK